MPGTTLLAVHTSSLLAHAQCQVCGSCSGAGHPESGRMGVPLSSRYATVGNTCMMACTMSMLVHIKQHTVACSGPGLSNAPRPHPALHICLIHGQLCPWCHECSARASNYMVWVLHVAASLLWDAYCARCFASLHAGPCCTCYRKYNSKTARGHSVSHQGATATALCI